MMRLRLIGVNHNDPMSRVLLERHLTALAQDPSWRAAGVAVEYDERYHHRVIELRPVLYRELSSHLSHLPQLVLAHVAETWCYEPSAVKRIMPGAPLIWLEEGRDGLRVPSPSFVATQYALALADLAIPEHTDLDVMLRQVSAAIQRSTGTEAVAIDGKRETRMYQNLLQGIARHRLAESVVVIVGARHIVDDGATIRSKLRELGGISAVDLAQGSEEMN